MTSPKQPINLFKGYPSPSLHPTDALLAAASTVLKDPSITVPGLSYGPDEGHGPLREAVAKWLTDFYKPTAGPITKERVVITGGASQNLAAALNVFTDPALTKAVWMISPTYYLACRIFDDAGFRGRLKAVPEDSEGIDIDALEKGLEDVEKHFQVEETTRSNKSPQPWRKIYSHIIYGVPTFANPSGKIMSKQRREQLLRLSRRYNALIITDDVYDMLCWPATATAPATSSSEVPQQPSEIAVDGIPRLVDLDRTLDGGPLDNFGNALCNGSFSKIVAPGCRVGYCEGTPRLVWGVSQAGSSRSGGAPSQFTSTLICDLLTSGWLDSHIKTTLRPTYKRRAEKLLAAVREYLLPVGVHFTLPWQSSGEPERDQLMGGYFVWLRLPDELKVSAIELAALVERQENVLFTPGNACMVDGAEEEGAQKKEQDVGRYIRLCFAYEEEDLLAEGVQRIAEVISREVKKGAQEAKVDIEPESN
ncbi:hypothetical protein KEM55_006892 [Ascosphaera atra]|nr:hypothetical protein KEM55_006892 [Ascosphaera atra]